MFGWKKKFLPLFIKPRQIQLACGLPSNPINLLSCESTQQLLPISHFSQLLIRSAQDIQWVSLQLHLRCYSCCWGFETTASVLISPSLSVFPSPAFSLFLSFSSPVILLPCSSTIHLSPLLSCFPSIPLALFNPAQLFHHPTLHLSLSHSAPTCSYTEATKQLGQ